MPSLEPLSPQPPVRPWSYPEPQSLCGQYSGVVSHPVKMLVGWQSGGRTNKAVWHLPCEELTLAPRRE